MKLLPSIVSFAACLALATSSAQAGVVLADFNGSGFLYEREDAVGRTTIGTHALEIDATERGGGIGAFGSAQDLTGHHIALTLKLADDNEADEFWVGLVDGRNFGVSFFIFKASDFTTSGFTTVVLDGPSVGSGAVDYITEWWFNGDYGSSRRLHAFIDHIEAFVPETEPPNPVSAPGTLLLAAAALAALGRRLRAPRTGDQGDVLERL